MSREKKIVLITGAGGFIGQHLIKKLKKFRYSVILTDTNSRSRLTNCKFDYYKCDLTKESEIKRLSEKIRGKIILVHLAAYVPKSLNKNTDLIQKAMDINLKATAELLEQFKNKLCKVCFASTLEVYGRPQYLPIDENHPTDPTSFYGLSKLMAEYYLRAFCKTHNIALNIMRFSSVYGPGELYDRAIPNFIRAALTQKPVCIYGDGQDLRDYINIEDAVCALMAGVSKINACGIFNIASGKGNSIKNIARLIIDLSNSSSKIKFCPRRKNRYDLIFSISQAKKKLGFSPRVDIQDGLTKEINWFKARN